jgi:5,10-methylenetetrahydromethanopterin reductase
LLNNCYHIVEAFLTLQEVYGNRFIVGLAPGDLRSLIKNGAQVKHPLKKVKSCASEFRRSLSPRNNSSNKKVQRKRNPTKMPIYVGASGPKMIEMASRTADGVLLNYVYPDFIKWGLKFFSAGMCRKVSYGPTLLKPDVKNLQLLRISAAIVFSGANRSFLAAFGLENKMVEVRRILERKRFSKLKQYDDILLEKFAIYGSLKEIEDIVEELQTLGMNQIVFSTPLCRNLRSMEKIAARSIHQHEDKRRYV